MIHKLKTWPDPFEAVWDGRKPYEIRKADRPFAVGDRLYLQEWIPESDLLKAIVHPGKYTEREIRAVVSYMTPGGSWGLPSDLCVLGLSRVERYENGKYTDRLQPELSKQKLFEMAGRIEEPGPGESVAAGRPTKSERINEVQELRWKRLRLARDAYRRLASRVPLPDPGAPGGEIRRAGGGAVCAECGMTYHDHPLHPDGDWATILCDGSFVKL